MAVLEETKERDVQNQLLWDDRVLSTDVIVEVTDSTAILSGTVPTYADKIAAEDDALSVPGILSVENNLVISFPEGYTVFSDKEIKNSIEDMLIWNPRIDATKIFVQVNAGIVTLEGSVDAFWKKGVASDIALQVSGVTDVINNLNVVWTESFEDERIADDVKNALRRNALIDAEDITVGVANGVVTLSGRVSSRIAKRTY